MNITQMIFITEPLRITSYNVCYTKLLRDLFLVVVIVVTLLRGFYNGALFCIILGMTHDIISARFIGVHTLLCLLISLLVGLIHRRVYKENLFVLLVLTFSSTVIYEIRITSYNVCYTKLLRINNKINYSMNALGNKKGERAHEHSPI